MMETSQPSGAPRANKKNSYFVVYDDSSNTDRGGITNLIILRWSISECLQSWTGGDN